MSDVQTKSRLAKVIHLVDSTYSPTEVVINRGRAEGIKEGDQFLIFGIGPHLIDPDTGEDLGELELVRGRGRVVHVQEHLATLRTIERRRGGTTKRILREPSAGARWLAPGLSGRVIEEELPPETELPFEAVQLGDLAKPI